MNCVIGLGSNLGDRAGNLEKAIFEIRTRAKVLNLSPVYTTPALIPVGGPAEWQLPFLNSVAELEWPGSARDLLSFLKSIEVKLGRKPSARWAPRVLDLDLLFFGDERISELELEVPHRELWRRSFVLDPLKDIKPKLFDRARALSSHQPAWVGILNVTPDSFSDGGELMNPTQLSERVRTFQASGVQVIDLGAESTRPGAQPLTAEEEWTRLKPALQTVQRVLSESSFHPLLSLDTRHPENARRAIESGIRWINDVSALGDLAMLDVLKDSNADYILMHSLSVPADPKLTLSPDEDVVRTLREWALEKLDQLGRAGIATERVIFDPGVGFGKTAWQSIEILKRIEEFKSLPCRLLVGHSRKGFLKTWLPSTVDLAHPASRDPESVGVSLSLARRGVDYIRVHDPELHLRTYHAFCETEPAAFT